MADWLDIGNGPGEWGYMRLGEDHREALSQLIQATQELWAATLAGGSIGGAGYALSVSSVSVLGTTATIYTTENTSDLVVGSTIYIAGHEDPRDGDYVITRNGVTNFDVEFDPILHPLPDLTVRPYVVKYVQFPGYPNTSKSKPTADDLIGVNMIGFEQVLTDVISKGLAERGYRLLITKLRSILEWLLSRGNNLRWFTDDDYDTQYTISSILSAGSYGPSWVQWDDGNILAPGGGVLPGLRDTPTGIKWQTVVLMQIREIIEKLRFYRMRDFTFTQTVDRLFGFASGSSLASLESAWDTAIAATPDEDISSDRFTLTEISGIQPPHGAGVSFTIDTPYSRVMRWPGWAGTVHGVRLLYIETARISHLFPMDAIELVENDDPTEIDIVTLDIPDTDPALNVIWRWVVREKLSDWLETDRSQLIEFVLRDPPPADSPVPTVQLSTSRQFGRFTPSGIWQQIGDDYDPLVDEYISFELEVDTELVTKHLTYGAAA